MASSRHDSASRLGQHFLLSAQELSLKQPRFDHNADFDTSVFGLELDYFLAGSIWTHCAKAHLEKTLDGFQRHSTPNGVFLASYLPATSTEDDYQGDCWVGTSHESGVPGVIRHSLGWIQDAARQRQLRVTVLPELDCDSQHWLRLDKRRS